MGLVSLLENTPENLLCLSLRAHNEKVTAYKPGRELSPKIDHAATLTVDFSL